MMELVDIRDLLPSLLVIACSVFLFFMKYTKEDLKAAVSESHSMADLCRHLGISSSGDCYNTLRKRIDLWGLDTSHFGRYKRGGAGWHGVGGYRRKLDDVLVKDSSYQNVNHLRKRLIAEGYKEARCESCGSVEWLGFPIKLELHHKNGNNRDNRIENLSILCPNCHAYTDNYRGRNKVSASSERKNVECRKFEEALTGKADGDLEPSRKEGVETRHGRPNPKQVWLRNSPDHKQIWTRKC